jgi:bacteriocin-like protein
MKAFTAWSDHYTEVQQDQECLFVSTELTEEELRQVSGGNGGPHRGCGRPAHLGVIAHNHLTIVPMARGLVATNITVTTLATAPVKVEFEP